MKRSSEGRGNWNRAGRRSGGDRKIDLGHITADSKFVSGPHRSIQCFGNRHGDCTGRDTHGASQSIRNAAQYHLGSGNYATRKEGDGIRVWKIA